jgi:hypothetical protein
MIVDVLGALPVGGSGTLALRGIAQRSQRLVEIAPYRGALLARHLGNVGELGKALAERAGAFLALLLALAPGARDRIGGGRRLGGDRLDLLPVHVEVQRIGRRHQADDREHDQPDALLPVIGVAEA